MIVESEFGEGTEEKIVAMDVAQTLCLTNELAVEIASIGAAVRDSKFSWSEPDILFLS